MEPVSLFMQELDIIASKTNTSISRPVKSEFQINCVTAETHILTIHSAADTGMKVLRAGGVAADAVEAAIRILEDREITNAGFGSNLTLDGVVECDAIMVDHHGRSGACGAVARERIDNINLPCNH